MVCQCFSSQDKRIDDQLVQEQDTEEPLVCPTDPEMPHTQKHKHPDEFENRILKPVKRKKMKVGTMRDTTSSNMNSDLHPSAYGTFMNTPITPGLNQGFSEAAKNLKKSAVKKEEPTYILNNV